MSDDKPISNELAALLPVLSQTMEFAVQSIRQSTALANVLIAKGVLTREELDKALKASNDPAKTLVDMLQKMNVTN